MSERDPRIDPRPGDVLRVNGEGRQVAQLFPNGLRWWNIAGVGDLRGSVCMFRTWRKWARNAEVITRAEDVQP